MQYRENPVIGLGPIQPVVEGGGWREGGYKWYLK